MEKRSRWILLIFVLLNIPCLFWGAGRDEDSHFVIEKTVKPLLSSFSYVPSRFTGNPVHEAGSAVAYWIAGQPGANAVTLFAAVMAGLAFLQWCRVFEAPHRDLLLAILLFHPLFFCNASCAIDYLWAIALFLWGFLYLRDGRWILAGVLFGLAVGARLASVVPIAGMAIGLIIVRRRSVLDVTFCALVAIAAAISCYLPSLRYYEYDVHKFLNYGIGSWSLFQQIARWVLRNVYFWGIQAWLILVPATWFMWRGRRGIHGSPMRRDGLVIAVCAFVAMELLYLKIPLEMGYLLPVLPFFLLIVGMFLEANRKLLICLFVAVLSYHVVSLNLLSPDSRNQAKSGAFDVRLQYGYTINANWDRFVRNGWVEEGPAFYFVDARQLKPAHSRGITSARSVTSRYPATHNRAGRRR